MPYADVERFCAEVRIHGTQCQLVGYEGATHGFFLPQNAEDGKWYRETVARSRSVLDDARLSPRTRGDTDPLSGAAPVELSALILTTGPSAFAGGIPALLAAGETWNVWTLVGLIGWHRDAGPATAERDLRDVAELAVGAFGRAHSGRVPSIGGRTVDSRGAQRYRRTADCGDVRDWPGTGEP